MSNQISWK